MGSIERGAETVKRWFRSQAADIYDTKFDPMLPTVDYFKAKYQLEDIEVIGLLIGARGVIPKFFESFRKTFELPQTLTADSITSVLKRSCQILSHHIHFIRAQISGMEGVLEPEVHMDGQDNQPQSQVRGTRDMYNPSFAIRLPNLDTV
ncbi:hypothetical protein ANN_23042 [Periplaneta americana]|uniref:Uncharacterized protein n=1 Tax=Periplaneta americana TaxID=6978 RepID=A0ABQ8SL46_PERAM|nr:hypothetical protein ANN_23042 [Periplaneta americana]